MTNKDIIIRPVITEKASNLGAVNQYVFLVKAGAPAPEVKKAVEQLYKVKVVKVHTINIPSKMKRIGRNLHERAGYRKAVVTLKKGEKLDILTA